MFDEWLRERAADFGRRAPRPARSSGLTRDADGTAVVDYRPKATTAAPQRIRARAVIGADGAMSAVARQSIPDADGMPYVFAYHEIVRSPHAAAEVSTARAATSTTAASSRPISTAGSFPHGDTTSVGTGSAHKGFSLRDAVGALRDAAGLDGVETIRREGAPIPLRPLPRWDNGRDVVLAGDAAGVVAPASGEGIYYAMTGGRLAAEAVDEFLRDRRRALRSARKRFMRAHGGVFWILGIMQRFWYANDKRRERFVNICRDRDVQQLTWDAYMNKELVRARPDRACAHLLQEHRPISPAWCRHEPERRRAGSRF